MRTTSVLILMSIFSQKAAAQPTNDLEKSNLNGRVKQMVETIYKVVAGKQKLESKSTTLFNEKGNYIEFRSCLSEGGCSLQQYIYDKEDKLREQKTYWKNVLESKTTYQYRGDSAFSTMYRHNDWGNDTVTNSYRPSDAKYVNIDGLIEAGGKIHPMTEKVFDKQGNWTSGKLYFNGSHYLHKRTITYYDSPK